MSRTSYDGGSDRVVAVEVMRSSQIVGMLQGFPKGLSLGCENRGGRVTGKKKKSALVKIRPTWIQIPAWPLTSCVILSKTLNDWALVSSSVIRGYRIFLIILSWELNKILSVKDCGIWTLVCISNYFLSFPISIFLEWIWKEELGWLFISNKTYKNATFHGEYQTVKVTSWIS